MSGDMFTQSGVENRKLKTYVEITLERTEALKNDIMERCPSKFYHLSNTIGCKANTSGLCSITLENCPMFFGAYVAVKATRGHIWE